MPSHYTIVPQTYLYAISNSRHKSILNHESVVIYYIDDTSKFELLAIIFPFYLRILNLPDSDL